METIFVNSPVTSEFPEQRPVRRSFYVFFDLRNTIVIYIPLKLRNAVYNFIRFDIVLVILSGSCMYNAVKENPVVTEQTTEAFDLQLIVYMETGRIHWNFSHTISV